MRYVMARYKEYQRELAYRIYVTDSLRMITENTAKFGGGSYMQARFAEIVGFGDNRASGDSRTRDEVISHVFDALKKVRGGEES